MDCYVLRIIHFFFTNILWFGWMRLYVIFLSLLAINKNLSDYPIHISFHSSIVDSLQHSYHQQEWIEKNACQISKSTWKSCCAANRTHVKIWGIYYNIGNFGGNQSEISFQCFFMFHFILDKVVSCMLYKYKCNLIWNTSIFPFNFFTRNSFYQFLLFFFLADGSRNYIIFFFGFIAIIK